MHHAAAIFLPRSAYRIERGGSNVSDGQRTHSSDALSNLTLLIRKLDTDGDPSGPLFGCPILRHDSRLFYSISRHDPECFTERNGETGFLTSRARG